MSNKIVTNLFTYTTNTAYFLTLTNASKSVLPDGWIKIESIASSARAIGQYYNQAGTSLNIISGNTYALIVSVRNIVGTIGSIVNQGSGGTATFTVAGGWNTTRTTDGKLALIITCTGSGTFMPRWGLNPHGAGGVHPMSMEIGEIMFSDITGKGVPDMFVPYGLSAIFSQDSVCTNIGGYPVFGELAEIEFNANDVILVVGDSFSNDNTEWPQIVSISNKVMYVNAVAGRTLEEALVTFTSQKDLSSLNWRNLKTYQQFPSYICRPGTVIVAIGINDLLAGASLVDLQQRVLSVESLCTTTDNILIFGLPPFKNKTSWTQDKEDIRIAFNEWSFQYCQQNTPKLRYFPINHILGAAPEYDILRSEFDTGDHLHPSSPGSAAIASGVSNYITAPYGIWSVAPTTNDGPPRNNITRLTGTSTTIDPVGTYKLADTQTARDATGFVYGVDHWAFTSTGIPKEIPGSVLIANGGGDQFFCGSKRIAGYSNVQEEPALTKIKRLTGVA